MRKVLLTAYFFPPALASESIRSLKTVKYLPRFGLEPVILTTSKIDGRADPSLLDELPSGISVYRVASLMSGSREMLATYLRRRVRAHAPAWCKRLRKHFENYRLEWVIPAIVQGTGILKEEEIGVILSRSTPVGSHFVGLALKLLSGRPWVMDFSDPWTQNPFASPNRIVRGLEVLAERIMARLSDRIVFTSDYARLLFLKQHPDIQPDKVEVISNSFDPLDFEGLAQKKTTKFTITHVGNFYGHRSPEPFLNSLQSLRNEDRSLQILVRFIGNIGLSEAALAKYGLCDIEVLGGLPHREALSYLFQSDVLLVVDTPASGPSMFIPMKLVEYLRVGRPILALTPAKGASADVIQSTRTGIVVSPTNEQAIANAIRDLYTEYRHCGLSLNPDNEEIEKYSAEYCTAKLAQLLEKLT